MIPIDNSVIDIYLQKIVDRSKRLDILVDKDIKPLSTGYTELIKTNPSISVTSSQDRSQEKEKARY